MRTSVGAVLGGWAGGEAVVVVWKGGEVERWKGGKEASLVAPPQLLIVAACLLAVRMASRRSCCGCFLLP